MKTYFTSESVTCGHPDKVCDQIADAVLDDILANDPDAHVACEVTACTGEVHLMGEITSSYVPDYEAIARKVIAEIGYTVPVVCCPIFCRTARRRSASNTRTARPNAFPPSLSPRSTARRSASTRCAMRS